MYSSLVVANRLLALAREKNQTLTPMQLIKLVYMCHGWMLGLYGRPLIRDEVQAWKFGPVIPQLYRVVRDFRSSPVADMLAVPTREPELDEVAEDIIRQVSEIYGNYDGITLSNMTHQPGTPWAQTWDLHGWGLGISNDLIESHYRSLAQRYGANNG